jgi:NADH:ubiquinone oxidoreductase subunit 6 (subunit J)
MANGLSRLFRTTTSAQSPLDASGGDSARTVSDFLTIQSFTNFAAMTGALTAAWNALQRVVPGASAIWVPYVFALAFAAVSILMSLDGLKKDGASHYDAGTVLGAVFVGVINALVLAGAVVGTNIAVMPRV